MPHFSAHCKTFIFTFLTTVEGIKMKWNKLENRVTPVLFYPVYLLCIRVRIHWIVCLCVHVMMHFRCILKMNGYGPLFLCSAVCICPCPSICALDVCFISFIVIFNSRVWVILYMPMQFNPTSYGNHRLHIPCLPNSWYYKFNVNQMNWSVE